MQNLDRRVTALETAEASSVRRVIRCNLDEAPEAACKRFGLSPDDPSVLMIRRVIVDPPARRPTQVQ